MTNNLKEIYNQFEKLPENDADTQPYLFFDQKDSTKADMALRILEESILKGTFTKTGNHLIGHKMSKDVASKIANQAVDILQNDIENVGYVEPRIK